MFIGKKISPILYFFISLIEGIVTFLFLLSIPPDPKNAFLFGYSISRLVLLFIVFTVSTVLCFQLFRSFKSRHESKFFLSAKITIERFSAFLWFLIPILWIFIWLPAHQFGKYAVLYSRIQPLIIFFSLLLFQLIVFAKFKSAEVKKQYFRDRLSKKLLIVGGVTIGIVWLFMILTRIGLDIDFSYWGGASIPVLPSTIFFAIYISVAFQKINVRFSWIQKHSIILIPLLIYLVAVIAWTVVDYVPTFFAPKPVPPNYEVYPYSDAHLYDVTAQSLLAGEGYLNRGFVQRPLFGFLIFLFHLIVGQDYFSVIFLQVLILASIPVFLYLIGRRLHSNFVGTSLALVAIIREITAQKISAYIEVVNSQMLMSDLWAALFVIVLCYLMIRWYQSAGNNFLNLVFISIVFAISLLMRLNILFLVFPFMVIVLLKAKFSLKNSLLQLFIFSSISFVVLFPWMYRNLIFLGEFGIENTKFELVIQSRYNLDQENVPKETTPNSGKPEQMLVKSAINSTLTPNIFGFDEVLNITEFTIANFLHNEVHSVLILPNSLTWNSVEHLVEVYPYFEENWEGNLHPYTVLSIILNLTLLILGVSYLFKKVHWLGLLPLFIHIFYNLSNGLARVSGWRYVIVTDWVIYLYYILGVYLILKFVLENYFGFSVIRSNGNKQFLYSTESKLWPRLIFAIMLALIPLLMVIPEIVIQPKFEGEISKESFYNHVNIEDYPDLERDYLDQVLATPDIQIVHAKALYPRYYEAGLGEPGRGQPWFASAEKAHLGFSIVGPVISGVSMDAPLSSIGLAHFSEVYIIGEWVTSAENVSYLNGHILFIPDSMELIISKSKMWVNLD